MSQDNITANNPTQLEKKCPHLGEEFQPLTTQLEDPYPFYQRARVEEPVFYSPLLKGYVLTRYGEILTVLKDPIRFSSVDTLKPVGNFFSPQVLEVLSQGFPYAPDIIESDGEAHKRLREPLMKVFTPEHLQAMENVIPTIANRLINAFINDGQVEIVSQFADPLPLEIILTMYGVSLDRMENIKKWSYDLNALISSPQPSPEQVEFARGFVAMQHYVAGLIEERRNSPQDDFISNIITSDLTMPELVTILIGLIHAGHKTTSHLIGNSLKYLLERPQLWQRLCHDPSLIPIAVEEILRYDPPVPTMSRTTTQEVELAGVKLPKGTRLFLMFGSANRDEAKFSNAERLDIERFKNTTPNHFSFGHGTHRCIGSNLALREARIALEILSQRLPNLRLRPNQEFRHTPAITSRGYASLEVEWDIP